MKKLIVILTVVFAGTGMMILNGCATTSEIASKSGSQLWGETCKRCHNAPSSEEFSGAQWETIGMHMKLRANLTDAETKKIIAFLQSGN